MNGISDLAKDLQNALRAAITPTGPELLSFVFDRDPADQQRLLNLVDRTADPESEFDEPCGPLSDRERAELATYEAEFLAWIVNGRADVAVVEE